MQVVKLRLAFFVGVVCLRKNKYLCCLICKFYEYAETSENGSGFCRKMGW